MAVLTLGAVACWCDIRSRRLPNWLTFGGAAAGLVWSLWAGGPWGLGTALGGGLVGAAPFFPVFGRGGPGAADGKAMGWFGAWLGPMAALQVGLYAALAGGVMALIVALATGYLRQALANFGLLLVHWRVAGISPLHELTLDHSGGPRLPYALPIVAGA